MHRFHRPTPSLIALSLALVLTGCHTTPSEPQGNAEPTIQEYEAAAQAAAKEAQAAADAAATVSEAQSASANRRARAEVAQRRMLASGARVDGYAAAPPPMPVAGQPTFAAPMVASDPASELDQVTVTGSLIARDALRYSSAGNPANTEKYAQHEDNPVHRVSEQPVSTFSIDVDTGSYSNVRRMLAQGVRPPADAVRTEEFLNYFDYGHPAPASRTTPFRVSTELASAPWNAKRQLLMVGIKGYDVPKAELPPANLVFLIDTSGSMQDEDKLPLVKTALRNLVRQLRPQDRVSMVVYAGSAGLVLPPTNGDDQPAILGALDRLEAGGSTNGGDGIRLAYAMARQAFVEGGVNRVILATDGDFNVGTIDQDALETLVADQRKTGIALTTLGFGQGNYNDALAERLADVGDGNHAYIDTEREARKVLVQEMGATLLTIARDVKIQVEFNPAVVAEYRLIGYENRLLNREDFANDKIDAGDIGAGHEVTALYEITPVDSDAQRLPPLRYATTAVAAKDASRTAEAAHLRLRYKRPGESTSRLIETPIVRSTLTTTPGPALRFAAAVAAFADVLRGGGNIGEWDWPQIRNAARQSIGEERFGERAELVELIGQAERLVAPDSATAQISE